MKINKSLIPLKAHFFFYLGSISPIRPFLTVVAVQLGIPLSIQGAVLAVSVLLPILTKPIIAVLADTFSHLRKTIFMVILVIVIASYCSIWFIPPLKDSVVIEGQLVRASVKSDDAFSKKPISDIMLYKEVHNFSSQTLLLTYNSESCYVEAARKCLLPCKEPCIIGSMPNSDISVKMVDMERYFQIVLYPLDPISNLENETLVQNYLNVESLTNTTGHLYQLDGVNSSWDFFAQNITLECQETDWIGINCATALLYWEFWAYALLAIIAEMSSTISYSISAAIAVDLTRDNPGGYGNQRAWGTIGYALVAPLGGLLVDLWSGSSVTKNYFPAFLLVFIFGCMDLVICGSFLKVPQIESDANIWKIVMPLLLQPRFSIFFCFVVLIGFFDGIICKFLFVMQEEIAQGTSAMSYIKFLQGLSIVVQCVPEALFMFVNGWFIKRLGPQRVMSLVFLVYTLRLLGLSLSIFYGSVWATLFTETLHGIAFGLGYPAIVEHATRISPSGTSTTIQSIINICYESFGFSLASFLGGILIETFGGFMTYLVTSITCFMVFILHVFLIKSLPAPKGNAVGGTSSSIETATGNPKDNLAFSKEEQVKPNQNGVAQTVPVTGETVQIKVHLAKVYQSM